MTELEIILHVPDAECPECGDEIDLYNDGAVIEVHYVCPCCGQKLAFCTGEELNS